MAVKNRFDVPRFKLDYNRLNIGGIMSFLYFSKKSAGIFIERFKADGMETEGDFVLRAYPVLGVGALPILGECPTTELSKLEFRNYCEKSGSLEPSEERYPDIAALDQAIPRRTNRALASDSLPRVVGLHQIYIERLSNRRFRT